MLTLCYWLKKPVVNLAECQSSPELAFLKSPARVSRNWICNQQKAKHRIVTNQIVPALERPEFRDAEDLLLGAALDAGELGLGALVEELEHALLVLAQVRLVLLVVVRVLAVGVRVVHELVVVVFA